MDDFFVEDLKSRVDLVDIVSKHAILKKSGQNLSCKSPFRNERTPSFSVSPQKQVWYDFGAAEGGDIISFIEKIENCSFGEAIEYLADVAGVEVPQKKSGDSVKNKAQKNKIILLQEKALEFFEREFQKNKTVQFYAKNRGLTQKMIQDWRLGYGGEAPSGLSQNLLQQGFTESEIADSGVSFSRNFGDKKIQDRFFDRFMIPIFDGKNGEVVAFSGRALKKTEKAKYINSPETSVYHKSTVLFGFYQAKEFIKEQDAIILVEGNLDVIFAHGNGFCNTVATCGTALTEEHLRMIKRLTKNIYIAFDNDLAGKKATLKAVEMTLKQDLNPFIVEIPEKFKDFGELLVPEGNAIVLQKIIKESDKAINFLLDRFAKKILNNTLESEERFLDTFFHFLSFVSRPIEIDSLLEKISQKIKRSKSVVELEFERFKKKNTFIKKDKFVPETKIRFSREQHFFGFLSHNWNFFYEKEREELEALKAIFIDQKVLQLFIKKLENQEIESEDEKNILAWEMYGQNLQTSDEADFLKREFQNYQKFLQREKEKKARTLRAKNFKGKEKTS